MSVINDELDQKNIEQQVEAELTRRRQAEAAAATREANAREVAERAALLEQAALRQTEARARLNEAITAT